MGVLWCFIGVCLVGCVFVVCVWFVFFQAEEGRRGVLGSRGRGEGYEVWVGVCVLIFGSGLIRHLCCRCTGAFQAAVAMLARRQGRRESLQQIQSSSTEPLGQSAPLPLSLSALGSTSPPLRRPAAWPLKSPSFKALELLKIPVQCYTRIK